MATGITYGTMANSGNGYSFSWTSDGRPALTPAGLIVTRAVETKKGWRGQVIVDKEIIHETKTHRGSRAAEDAQTEVNRYVLNRIKSLFGPQTVDRVEEGD